MGSRDQTCGLYGPRFNFTSLFNRLASVPLLSPMSYIRGITGLDCTCECITALKSTILGGSQHCGYKKTEDNSIVVTRWHVLKNCNSPNKAAKKQHGFQIWIFNFKFSTLLVILVKFNYIWGYFNIDLSFFVWDLCPCYGSDSLIMPSGFTLRHYPANQTITVINCYNKAYYLNGKKGIEILYIYACMCLWLYRYGLT